MHVVTDEKKNGNVFFKVPKILFSDDAYKTISTDAKMLYALLQDRKQLSKKNGFQNRIGDHFVYMTIAETCAKLNCGHEKACRLFNELESYGLIFREGQGFGKAVKIYPVELC